MLNVISPKGRILFSIIIIAIIYSTLTYRNMQKEYTKYRALSALEKEIVKITDMSRLIHFLQMERGYSVGYVSSKAEQFQKELQKQREKTDVMVDVVRKDKLLQRKKLAQIRSEIDNIQISLDAVLDYYSDINNHLLSSIRNISYNSKIPEITRILSSYTNFLSIKELVGVERAVGTAIFSSPKLEKSKVLELSFLISMQDYYSQHLLNPPIIDLKQYPKIVDMEKIMLSLSQKDIEKVDASLWFGKMSEKINYYAKIEKKLTTQILQEISKEYASVMQNLILVAIVNLVALGVFFMVIFFILKVIRNEKKLQELSDEYIISSSTNAKGIIVAVSSAFVDISGYTEGELLGKPHKIVRHPDMSDTVFKDLWKTIQEGRIWVGDVKNLKKDGEYYWTRATIVPEFDKFHKIIGYTSIRHDITSEKVKEEFMANMSHELRTPLNAIIGFSGILERKLQEPKDINMINKITSSAKNLLKLINDILDLSKIQNAQFSIEAYEFNAYDEMKQYATTFKGLMLQKDLKLFVEIEKELQTLFFGDWMRINQIILNLISNAIKFTPKGGTIIFKSSYRDGKLLLHIEDSGIGMSKEIQEKIFKPFTQADGSTTRRYGGTGLGLSITQNLVDLMGGSMQLFSTEGVGSTFTVEIPLKKIASRSLKSEETKAERSDKAFHNHILVAEDNDTNQILITMLLEEFGVSCDIAQNGEEAVKLYNPSLHDFILMDENMPKMNGLEAMKILKEKFQEQCGAIIALTANSMSGDKERFLELGMDDYLSKPVDVKELERVLTTYGSESKMREDYVQNAINLTLQRTRFAEDKIIKLMHSYYKSSLRLLQSFKNGVDADDFKAIKNASHDLKSSSYMLDFTEIGHLAEVTEKAAGNQEPYAYEEAYEEMRRHLEAVKKFLEL